MNWSAAKSLAGRIWRRLAGLGATGGSAARAYDPTQAEARRRSFGEQLPLWDLFAVQGTDKGWYCDIYEILLRPYRETVRAVLEIGIGSLSPAAKATMHGYAPGHYRPGGSLRAWREYFPHAEIVGIDVEPDTQFAEPRITTHLCNSTDAAAAAALLAELPPFDLVIDDGSHAAQDQLDTLRNFFGAVAPGGLYLIEDIPAGSALFRRPALVEPFVAGSPYFAICEGEGADLWKMIVIQRPG